MSIENSFSYIFRKYPLFRTVMWCVIICITIIATTVVNKHFTHEPILDSINPSVGSPGDVIVLQGEHFGQTRNESFVEIGGERLTASSYISWADKEIKILIPSNIQDGLVTVDVSGKRSKPSVFANESTIPVTVQPVVKSLTPEINSVTPSTASIGQLVTITGANFGSSRKDAGVYFKTNREALVSDFNMAKLEINSNLSSNTTNTDEFGYELWSDTEIKVRIPDGAVSGNIVVTTQKGISNSKNINISNKGTKNFNNGKFYLIQSKANISDAIAEINSSLTLHIPRPIVMPSQPTVELTECVPPALLENYKNTVIQQIELKDAQEKTKQFTQNFMVQVFAISCKVQKEKVKPYENKKIQLYTENTKETSYILAKQEKIVSLAEQVIKKEKNPYIQAELLYDYLIENFSLKQTVSTGNFDYNGVLETKQADAYDFAVLYVSLLRSIGVPSKIMSGILIDSETKTQNHWWNEFYIEGFGWIPVDIALGAGLNYSSFQTIENKKAFYFGNLDSQHIAFSANWKSIKASMSSNKIVYRPRSYALQNIWEEASSQTESYSSYWTTPIVLGVY